MKTSLIMFASLTLLTGTLESQIEPAGICNDKTGNMYCNGSFENMIDLGNRNIMKSAGSGDIFIAKYDPKGSCIWASHYGNENDETAEAICSDAMGNTFSTGNFNATTRFRNIKVAASTSKIYH